MDIVEKKFAEWTKGLGPKEARIAVYTHIRDIPYKLIAALRDPKIGPAGLLEGNGGSCNPKHVLLGSYLSRLGLDVKYANYRFNWDEPSVKYLPELRALAQKIPLGNHLAVKALIDGRWVLVDATYDLPLRKAGFTVTETWDGESGTKNAVTFLSEVLNDTIEERVKYDAAIRAKATEEQKAAYSEFMEKFNAWLEQVRKDD
ncbi:MAG: hypothetical protein WC512_03955 [Candidatus Omnitrophota bacterium]